MALDSINSSGKVMQQLVDYVEEIVKKAATERTRGLGSVEAFIDWLQRTYSYVNDEEQEFQVVVRTPDLAENKEVFAEFCNSISFAGSCVKQNKVAIDGNETVMNIETEPDFSDHELQLEIDFEVIDAKNVEPPYTVQFDFDPPIPFAVGSASISHRLMQEGIDGSNLNLTVSSVSGNFTAYVTPEFQLSGTAAVPKALSSATTVQFVDTSNQRRNYRLLLNLKGGDQYALSGSYAA